MSEEACGFINGFAREEGLSDSARRRRISEVSRSIRRARFYEHTPEELAFGCRVAWRNHSRCIGRLIWNSLVVRDCRGVHDPEGIGSEMERHMLFAYNGGRIRSVISVFPPVMPGKPVPYIESRQILQYAGYSGDSGKCIGDPLNIETTRIAMSLGWTPVAERGAFDILPVIIRAEDGSRSLFSLREDAVIQVDLEHPEYDRFSALGLRWYAIPCVSSMILSIGGIDYPCAPFNGFYMATEIASRNLSDPNRYDLLPVIADSMGGQVCEVGVPFWKDRALLELNRAVIYSFAKRGISITDHHTASEQYTDFVNREESAGRCPAGNWSWIVPPQASSACSVFHLPMQDFARVPAFYHSRLGDGQALRHYVDESEIRNSFQIRLEKLKHRYWRWLSRRDSLIER